MATDRRTLDRGVRALVAALKLAKPYSIVGVTNEGEEHAIALVGQRGRYERAARSALALNAVIVRCIDPDGKITETIGIDGAPAVEEGRPVNDTGRSFEKELRALLGIVVEAQDKVAGRYEGMMAAQAAQSKQLTEAAIGVMRVAADRSAKLEGAVLRLVSVREREVSERERELNKVLRRLSTSDESDDDGGDEGGDPFEDPNIQKLIDIAGRAVGIPTSGEKQ